MTLLLDTHAALWLGGDRERVPAPVIERVTASGTRILLSAVVVLEIAIKRSIGKLHAPADLVERALRDGAEPLSVSLDHAAAVAELPLHHRDPFDRLLVAQAQIEDATIVSADPKLRDYEVRVLWA